MCSTLYAASTVRRHVRQETELSLESPHAIALRSSSLSRVPDDVIVEDVSLSSTRELSRERERDSLSIILATRKRKNDHIVRSYGVLVRVRPGLLSSLSPLSTVPSTRHTTCQRVSRDPPKADYTLYVELCSVALSLSVVVVCKNLKFSYLNNISYWKEC